MLEHAIRTGAGEILIESRGSLMAARFVAMAGTCELLVESADADAVMMLAYTAAAEAWRIEKKYSRYRDDSVLAMLHATAGRATTLDEETASLIEFAQQCYELSDGLFDITSGILRRAWTFDCSDHVPDTKQIATLLPLIGFHKLEWRSPSLRIPPGMELDLGGIGKEYAVDRAYDCVAALSTLPFLVNFGGDLRANRPPSNGAWQVGIEQPDSERHANLVLDLEHGALATSGDSRRYVLRDGIRYGHILNPLTGWPVQDAPRSVTVAASSCTEAGILATIGLLQGAVAEEFLQEQAVRFWVQW